MAVRKQVTRWFKLVLLFGMIMLSAVHLHTTARGENFVSPPRPLPQAHEAEPNALRVIEEACVQCHDLYLVFSRQKTGEAWERTISDMIWRGAQMLPGEAEIIRDYLASGYHLSLRPTSSRMPTARVGSDDPLPDGSGKELVSRSCVQCHKISQIISVGKSREEWRLTVKNMIRFGTRLSARQSEIVIEYLTRFFAP